MLTVRVGERPEDLLEELLERLRVPLDEPFAAEWISVPSLGFRNWLRLELAQRLGSDGRSDGIVANVDLPFPGSLRWTVLRAHSVHVGHAAQDDPWQVDRLVWSVLHVLSDPPPGLDARLSRSNLPPGVALASRAGPIADLFDRYGVHRPDMLAAWSAGEDLGPDLQPLDGRHLWQPRLFRAVGEHIAGVHGISRTPSERLREALGMIRTGELTVTQTPGGSLPERMFVFGPSVLPADMGPILDALGVHREVTALLLSPSASVSHRMARSVAAQSDAAQPDAIHSRTSWAFPSSDPRAEITPDHPLLASWANRPLEAAQLLGAGRIIPDPVDPGGPAPETLLGQVQTDLRTAAVTEGAWSGRPGDGSIQIHRAPGQTRQVEVLRDVILGLLRDHPGLCESDIAVVCPHLEEYAPVITAVFGPSAQRGEQPEPDTVPALRYTVIDRNARSLNPVLDAMAKLLELLPGRFELTGVTELLAAPAVQQRFGLTSADLELLSEWMEGACIRWGLDGAHRQRWGISADHEANSWSAGIDQLMMGIALGDDLRAAPLPGTDTASAPGSGHDLSVGDIAPMSLGESHIGSAGRLAAALRSLARAHRLLQTDDARTPQAWCDDLRTAADLMVASQPFEDWQRARFDTALDDLLVASSGPDGAASEVRITYADMRRLLAPDLEGPRARSDMGFGSIVVARPSLLAGVPFPVVCVLGLDQEALPGSAASGDDLAHVVPFVGDRDPRSEARAELLSMLGAARGHLVITCTSTDVRTNEPVPESVLLDELIDVLGTTMGLRSKQLREPDAGVVCTHPRQAFDHRNFTSDGHTAPLSFDRTALDGAVALAQAGERPPGRRELLTSPLGQPDDPTASIELAELHRFFTHPVRTFLANRLNVAVPRVAEEMDAQLPTSLRSLDASAVGRELLVAGLQLAESDAVLVDPATGRAGAGAQEVIDGFRARGLLPPPAVSHPELVAISREVSAMLAMAERYGVRRAAAISHALDVILPGGSRLIGSVSGCIEGSCPGPVRIAYHRARPKHEISLALDLLVLTVAHPDTPWRGVAVTRPDKDGDVPVTLVREICGDTPQERRDTALEALCALVAQFRDGQCYPLPLFEKTSYEHHMGGKPKVKWNPGHGGSFPREAEDGYHRIAFGELDYDELTRIRPAGYSLDGEAARLWGTLEAALVDLHTDADGEVGP